MRHFLALLVALFAVIVSALAAGSTCAVRLPSSTYHQLSAYTGQCMHGLANGHGAVSVEALLNNEQFDGVVEAQFTDGIPEGDGSFTSHDGQLQFTGIFRRGEMWEGSLRATGSNGGIYAGEIQNGVPGRPQLVGHLQDSRNSPPSSYNNSQQQAYPSRPSPGSSLLSNLATAVVQGLGARATQALDSKYQDYQQQSEQKSQQQQYVAQQAHQEQERAASQAALDRRNTEERARFDAQQARYQREQEAVAARSMQEQQMRADAAWQSHLQYQAQMDARNQKLQEEQQARANQKYQEQQVAAAEKWKVQQQTQAQKDAEWQKQQQDTQDRLNQQYQELQTTTAAKSQAQLHQWQIKNDQQYQEQQATFAAKQAEYQREQQAKLDAPQQQEQSQYSSQTTGTAVPAIGAQGMPVSTVPAPASPSPPVGAGSSTTQAPLSAKDAADIASIQQNGSIAQAGNYGRLPGGVIVDLTTGQVVASAPQVTSTPVSQSPSAIIYSPTALPSTSQLTPEQIAQYQQELTTLKQQALQLSKEVAQQATHENIVVPGAGASQPSSPRAVQTSVQQPPFDPQKAYNDAFWGSIGYDISHPIAAFARAPSYAIQHPVEVTTTTLMLTPGIGEVADGAAAAEKTVSVGEQVIAGAAERKAGQATIDTAVQNGTKMSGYDIPFNDAGHIDEIEKTLNSIENGGPFNYQQDGTVFRNSEGNLPQGNYREYTVDTPGSSNRGSRRIVRDIDTGRTYYTDDHYTSFIQLYPK